MIEFTSIDEDLLFDQWAKRSKWIFTVNMMRELIGMGAISRLPFWEHG